MRRGLGANPILSGKRRNGSVWPELRGSVAKATREWQAAEPEMACQRWRVMVLQAGTPYTFSQILELNSETEKILADLGYRFRSAPLELPGSEVPRLAQQLGPLRAQMRERLPYVPLTNEAAYRAFYVTPLLFAALDLFRFKMNIAYAVAGGRLTGTVDFLLRGRHDLVVAGVKSEALVRGFQKLALQMVAVSEYSAMPTVGPKHPRRAQKAHRTRRAREAAGRTRLSQGVQTQIFGVVTAGPIWQFGLLERGQKRVTQDSETYSLPRDLGRLVEVFAGILGDSSSELNDVKREGERLSWANS